MITEWLKEALDVPLMKRLVEYYASRATEGPFYRPRSISEEQWDAYREKYCSNVRSFLEHLNNAILSKEQEEKYPNPLIQTTKEETPNQAKVCHFRRRRLRTV